MEYKYAITIVIPHRNSLSYLPSLFASIPDDDRIQIILVDNSPTPITKNQVKEMGIGREYVLLFSDPSRGAGGARNVGIESASGKWLIFADADDYFSSNAFYVFNSKKDSEADLIYTGMGGVYLDTGEPSDRGDVYTKLVRQFLRNEIPESDLRFKFSSPCCKMVSHDLVREHNLRYDEVTASNDMYFSMLCGYYAKKIEAVDSITYIATVSKGTLTRRRDYAVMSSRFGVYLRYNSFLKKHGYSQYQRSILNFAFSLCRMGIKPTISTLSLLLKYHQNPFIGWRNWFETFKANRVSYEKEKKYIIK